MKVIFVSGAYRADTQEQVCQNICRARKAALRLWQEGWAVICPHSNTALFHIEDELVLDGDIEMLKKCDAVYMLKGWEDSRGAVAELGLAYKLGMQIIYE